MSHSADFLAESARICGALNPANIDELASALAQLRGRGGRLFVLGVGGGAANASHAVNDFRKLCRINAYCPTDNVAELTARTNDEGWDSVFSEWLLVSQIDERDALLIFSVGGGYAKRNISGNLVCAIDLAKSRNAKVFGIVGKSDGYTMQYGDLVIIIPEVNSERLTPHTEAFQGVVLHCLVSNPILQIRRTKW